GEDRVAEVLANLVGVDVESGRELDVADVVVAEHDVHQTGDELVRRRGAVEVDALDQRRGAVTYSNDLDAHFFRQGPGSLRCCDQQTSICDDKADRKCTRL